MFEDLGCRTEDLRVRTADQLDVLVPNTYGLMMPAMFEAKFWMPPIDATCRELGATSPGSDQIPVAAIARLAYEIARKSSATYTDLAGAAKTIAAPPSSPPTITVLRTRVTSAPARIRRSATMPAIQPPAIAVMPGSVPRVPSWARSSPRASFRYDGNQVRKK
ncbi:hypothetical protein PWY36_27715 [Kribbella solani]|nr:hypothetical protein [Kribbella solani]